MPKTRGDLSKPLASEFAGGASRLRKPPETADVRDFKKGLCCAFLEISALAKRAETNFGKVVISSIRLDEDFRTQFDHISLARQPSASVRWETLNKWVGLYIRG